MCRQIIVVAKRQQVIKKKCFHEGKFIFFSFRSTRNQIFSFQTLASILIQITNTVYAMNVIIMWTFFVYAPEC